jgi:hypothetical protein
VISQSAIENRQLAIPSLRDTPRSSTKKQHQTLVLAALKHDIDIHELRRMVGGSLCALSAKDCSEWIKHFSGRDLPNPPGGKPWPYRRRRRGHPFGAQGKPERSEGSIPRVITASHEEQIGRLMLRYFEGNVAAASAWFLKNWKVKEPRDLLTTARAGKVIRALKDMLERRESPAAPSNQNEGKEIP